jgi:hypothetical protein
MVVLIAPAGSRAARAEVLEFAQIIGEADYARRVLIPLIEYKQASPDFLGTLRSTLGG